MEQDNEDMTNCYWVFVIAMLTGERKLVGEKVSVSETSVAYAETSEIDFLFP